MTIKHPTGIYVHSSKDNILLRDRECLEDGGCDDYEVYGAFDRYGSVHLIQNPIIWDVRYIEVSEGTSITS